MRDMDDTTYHQLIEIRVREDQEANEAHDAMIYFG